MKALRATRPLSLSEARRMAGELGRFGLRGTRVEMEVFARRLRAAGVAVEIRAERLGAGGAG